MNTHQYSSDNLHRRGYICKESILEVVSQEEIFQLVFGFLPEEYDYVVSPLREDKTPGAWFEYYTNGVLYFKDWAHTRTHSDCFNMVQDFFKIPNFYLTLQFIHDRLVAGKKVEMKTIEEKQNKIVVPSKEKVKLLIEARPFSQADRIFWTQYEINKKHLMEDKVFAVSRYYALNTKYGNVTNQCYDIVYSYNDFPNSRKKLYFPKREGKKRFLTNCTKDDVGGINSLMPYGSQLIITKSYKDYRVLKNKGKNVIWFQNEGMIPNETILNPLVRHFASILVWFDNDQPGIIASTKVVNHINSLISHKAKSLWLPEKALSNSIKDPSDCIAKDKHLFYNFLKDFT